jgi:Spy/CpxP family protein refolding chaperone
MKRKVLVSVVVILAVVALSTLTTIMYMRWFTHKEARFLPRREHSLVFLRRELGLSDAQIAEIEAQRNSFEKQIDSTQAELGEKRRAVMEELRANTPDTLRIDHLVSEIGVLQSELEMRAIRHMLREQAILTPEQREKFFSMFNRHFQQREEMPWPGAMERRGMERRGQEPRSFESERRGRH